MTADPGTYLQYWGLSGNPFANLPDPGAFYLSESHGWALNLFTYAVRERKAAGLLTGEYGSGKTTTIRALVANIGSEDFSTVVIDHPVGEGETLSRTILQRMGESAASDAAENLHEQLEARFHDNRARGKHNLVVLDEAQSLSEEALRAELRMLLDSGQDDRRLITLFLVGQDELWRRVSRVPRLADRFAVKCRLQELDREQTAAYVGQRIARFGGEPAIFPEEALRLIHDSSKGIPRRINNLCEALLMLGCRRRAAVVDAKLVKSIWV